VALFSRRPTAAWDPMSSWASATTPSRSLKQSASWPPPWTGGRRRA